MSGIRGTWACCLFHIWRPCWIVLPWDYLLSSPAWHSQRSRFEFGCMQVQIYCVVCVKCMHACMHAQTHAHKHTQLHMPGKLTTRSSKPPPYFLPPHTHTAKPTFRYKLLQSPCRCVANFNMQGSFSCHIQSGGCSLQSGGVQITRSLHFCVSMWVAVVLKTVWWCEGSEITANLCFYVSGMKTVWWFAGSEITAILRFHVSGRQCGGVQVVRSLQFYVSMWVAVVLKTVWWCAGSKITAILRFHVSGSCSEDSVVVCR